MQPSFSGSNELLANWRCLGPPVRPRPTSRAHSRLEQAIASSARHHPRTARPDRAPQPNTRSPPNRPQPTSRATASTAHHRASQQQSSLHRGACNMGHNLPHWEGVTDLLVQFLTPCQGNGDIWGWLLTAYQDQSLLSNSDRSSPAARRSSPLHPMTRPPPHGEATMRELGGHSPRRNHRCCLPVYAGNTRYGAFG
jgi:hypothetical protein